MLQVSKRVEIFARNNALLWLGKAAAYARCRSERFQLKVMAESTLFSIFPMEVKEMILQLAGNAQWTQLHSAQGMF